MASIPGYSATGRSRSSEASSISTARSEAISSDPTSEPPTADSMEDTETVFLNKSGATSDDVSLTPTQSPIQSTTDAVHSTFEEPRKCWICYTDETEESPLNAEWRSPCPCALTAHEACLLDWLADLENPRSRKRNGSAAKMVCPQCKTEIVVSRPQSIIVDVVRLFERMAGRLVLPGMVFTLAGTVWAGCCAHGVYSMYFVFGTEEARHILEETVDGPWNSGLNLGLPLIPLVLIFSRTRYAEGLLPAIPVLFFAAHHPGQEPDFDLWPPSAAVTFAALPYVKSFYTAVYDKLFGEMEKKWIAEVQPRSDVNEFDDNAPQQEQDDAGAMAENGRILMEIDLELQVGMGNGNDEPQRALGLQADGGNHQIGGGPEGQDGQNQGAGQNGQPLGLGRREDIIHETSNLADVVLGALVFPAISASVGGLLKYVLPKSWTTPTTVLDRARPGLLQTRWGRSVVGGCVFVLLKDALVLYCRWKLAQTHRKRRVLNYDRKKKKVEGNGR